MKRKSNKELVMNMLGGKCNRCGVNNLPPCCYDCHHVKGDKINIVSQLSGKTTALNEAKKCILLCANCHRIVHWEEKDAKNE